MGRLPGHIHGTHAVVFSHDGKTLASNEYEKIHLWDVATGRELRRIDKAGWRVAYFSLAALPLLIALPVVSLFLVSSPEQVGLLPDGAEAPRGLFSSDYEQFSHEALVVERKTILQLRNERVINDEVLRRFVAACLDGSAPGGITGADGRRVVALQHEILKAAPAQTP